jgi:signal transduction histidine kinase
MEPKGAPESAAVDTALAAWRAKAANILLAANAAFHLPFVVIVTLGSSPPAGLMVRGTGIAAYISMTAAALLWRFDYRKRLWAFFIPAYLVTAITNFAGLKDAYAKAGLLCVPVLALVLCGALAGRIAVAASAVILVSAPLLRVQPALMRFLGTDPTLVAEPAGIVWYQVGAMLAFLAAEMILLDRFHRLLLATLGGQCRAMCERQRLEGEIAAVSDRERRHLGRELHDGVCQQVTAAMLRCRALARRVDRGQTLSGADFEALSSLLAESIDDAHRVALGLCPLESDLDALAPALRALTNRTQKMGSVRCEFLAAGDVRVHDPAMAQHLYRIAQEALSNAARHAHASRITVELRGTEGELTLQVEDDGTGMPGESPGGMGLRTMAYRAQILGGELNIASAAGGGARVTCRVPRLASEPAAQNQPGDRLWTPRS